MERKRRASVSEHVYEEAGEWFLEFRDGEPDTETRRDFDGWIRRSPDHLGAYLEIAAIWNEAPALEAADAKTLIARAPQDSGNIVSLNQRSVAAEEGAGSKHVSKIFAGASLKVACLTIGLVAAAWFWFANDSVYSTGVGEQRTIALKDGSRIELNSRSRLRVLYSNEQRRVELLAGQALFSVAKDPARPFVVSSGNTRVRAVGTQFDVYRKMTGTVVTVVEGRVAIRDDARSVSPAKGNVEEANAAVLLSAGQQLVVTPSEIRKPTAANVSNATAWTQHELAFDAAALSDVVEEFNRYNERQLVIRDRGISDFRVSGVFSSSDPTGLIRFLRDRDGIRVIESSSEIVIEAIEETK